MNTQRRSGRLASLPHRSGSVLVEFAFIALAFYLLFAGTIELGRMITTAQAVQTAARVGSRELALIALPPTMTFRQALHDPDVRARVYDDRLLAVPISGGVMPDTDSWPVLNRMLTPMMIFDTVGGTDFYHFPGAVVDLGGGSYSVKVPIVVGESGGTQLVRLADVVEEVIDNNGVGPFSLAASAGVYGERGMVALRVNCPYQAATMTGFRVVNGHSTSTPIDANDATVQIVDNAGGVVNPATPTEPDPPSPFNFVGDSSDIGPYAGKYGMGSMYAFDDSTHPNRTVRPFRKVISSQALFRREVYR